MKRLIFATALALTFFSLTHSQTFTGFDAFKKIIKYEGQRFLMTDIYQVSSSEFDKLRIDKTISEVDSEEGFMFVLTSYEYNGENGVIITSFNSANYNDVDFLFRNVHLTGDEFTQLTQLFSNMKNQKPSNEEHLLVRFNNQLIAEVYNSFDGLLIILWVENYSRHTFTQSKWERAYKRFEKFVND